MGDPAVFLTLEPVFDTRGAPKPPFTNDEAANRLIGADPNAFLIGLVLDQQVRMATAWRGPYELQRRLGHFDLEKIAAMPEEEFLAVMAEKPAIHRFPRSMGKRVQDAARVVGEQYGGRADNIWRGQPDARTVMRRLDTVPGIGKTKQRLAMLLLGRYLGQEIPGWREAAPISVPA